MSLPEESLEAADERATDWDDDPGRAIYEHLEEMDYGLSGALERGLNVRHLHESEGQVNCYEHAIHAYTLAEALDLDPRFFEIEEGQTTHAFIDIEQDGNRYHIDQGRYGPIEHYSDHEVRLSDSPVNDNTHKGYKSITQKTEDELAQDIGDLRDDSVAMLARGQRLTKIEDGETTIYDKLIFDRDEDVLERMISFYEPVGHLNHLIRVKRYIDEDGNIEDTETILADIDSASWNTAWGERTIGTISDGKFHRNDDLEPELRENIVTVMEYEEHAGDELIYTDGQREELWDHYSTAIEGQIGDSYTGFRGSSLKNELERLQDLKEDNPERFHHELDWMRFLQETADQPLPDQETTEQHLEDYIQRHQDILAQIRDHPNSDAIETILSGLDSPTRDTIPDIEPDHLIDKLRETRLGTSYERFAEDLENVREGKDPDLQQHHPLLAADPDLREDYTDFLTYLIEEDGREELQDERAAVDDLLPEEEHSLEDPYDSIHDSWHLDPDDLDLVRTLVFDDGTVSTYNAVLEIAYDIDPLTDEDITVSMYDTPEGRDERLHYGTFTIETEDGIDLETVQETALENLDSIREKTPLNAPEPHKDTDVFQENDRAVALYSIYFRDDEDMPHLWTEDELDAFNEKVQEEAEFAIASPFHPVDEKDEAHEEIELVTDMFDDDWQHYAVAQHNKLESLRTTDNDQFEAHIQQQFTADERAEEYVKKFYDVADNHVTGEDNVEDAQEIVTRVENGLDQSLPTPADIDTVASEEGYHDLREVNQTIESTGYNWEHKASVLKKSLETLSGQIDTIESEDEQQHLEAALTSIGNRIAGRERYDEQEHGLLEEVRATKAEVQDHTPFTDLSDEVDEEDLTAALQELA